MSGAVKRERSRGRGGESAAKRARESISDDEDVTISQATPDFTSTSYGGPEPGVIERVSVRNFMCHDRLTVTIGHHINFIIGKNGSGKSAIMTAVVVGLGGKASATNRGSTIKSFIKTGKQSADVSVSLCNRGEDAYKHATYGDTITVERRLVADGGGGYKIKNVNGKTVSEKRSELNTILDHFNIQVDNPVSILNQDTSKSFLNSKSAKDKYKFFLKATQLEQMKEDYKEADQQKHSAEQLLKKKEDTLPELEKKVLEWEQKYKALEAVDGLKDKVKRLQNEMAWAFVIQKERGLEPKVKELEQEQARTPKYQRKLDEFAEKVEGASREFRSIQEEMMAMSSEAEQLQSRHNAAKEDREKKKKQLQQSLRERSAAANEVDSMNEDRRQVEEKLRELRNSAENDYSEQRHAREEKIAALSEAIAALRAQQTTTQHDVEQFTQAENLAQQQENAINTEISELKARESKLCQQVRNLESARSNKMRRFGQHMPEVLRRIEEEHRRNNFHRKPLGPIGAHVSLKEQSWAPATEMCLKSLLYSFCCHDHHDRDRLEKIFKATCPAGKSPAVIVSSFKDRVHDVSQHRVQSEDYPTLYDLLVLDDPVVANCLIDQRSIENVVMFADVAVAREVMLKRPPRKAREGFTVTGDQLYAAPNFRYYSNKDAKANVLTADLEADIQQAKADINSLRREITERERLVRDHRTTAGQNLQHKRKAQRTLGVIRDKINHHSYELNELRNVEEPVLEEDIATLEEDARQIKVQLGNYEARLEEINTRHAAVKAEFDEADAAFMEARDQLGTITERTNEYRERLATAEKQIDDVKYHHRHYHTKKQEHDKKVKLLQAGVAEYEKEIAVDMEKAKTVCEQRINTRRTAANLESEIHQLKKRIVEEEKVRGSREQITRTYHEKMDAYKKITKEVHQLANFLKQLQQVMNERKVAFVNFQRMIGIRARCFFVMMLDSRKYQGKIEFDHKSEQLNMLVQPKKQLSEQHAIKDMKGLSGGERSFSTVCFILALWDTIESPFRMLDEFDVFMDMVNRRIAMDLMLNAANNNSTKQFIFLTPLDMSYVKLPASAKVHQLQAPERGQSTLPFPRRRAREEEEEEEN